MGYFGELIRAKPEKAYVQGVKDTVDSLAICKDGERFVGVQQTPIQEVYDEIDKAYKQFTRDHRFLYTVSEIDYGFRVVHHKTGELNEHKSLKVMMGRIYRGIDSDPII